VNHAVQVQGPAESEEALMLVPITEQVFVPLHRIERISFFGTTAHIKYIDTRDVDRIENADAQRLMHFVNSVVAKASMIECQQKPENRSKR
jgi:hypothetical protein